MRNTLEFFEIREQLKNPDFKPVDFNGFRKGAICTASTFFPLESDIFGNRETAIRNPEEVSDKNSDRMTTYENWRKKIGRICWKYRQAWKKHSGDIEGTNSETAKVH